MSQPLTLTGTFEALMQWAMTPEHQDDVVEARAEYSRLAGDVFEEDRQLELRLTGFLEYYLCDRPAAWAQGTPARARYLEALQNESPERAAAWRAFTETWHGLFQVRSLTEGLVRVAALSTHNEVLISERRAMHGVSVGDVLEARLVPFGGSLAFSSAWVWHPHAAARLIVAEAERRRNQGLGERELLFDCARRSLKADRYRQIPLERIYDFSTK
jgi:hypothetical protein